MPFVMRPNGANIFYEVHGSGPQLFCGPPLFATPPSDMHRAMALAFIDELCRHYRLLFIDYPYGLGKSSEPVPEVFCVERVAEDFLAVADAAGFDRFAWYGYSWGAVTGMQLALRTDRLTALIAAGFPPLGGQYEAMLKSCRKGVSNPFPGFTAAYMEQSVRYYEDLQAYDDRVAVPQIKVPRMTFVGDRDVTDSGGEHYANIVKNRARLEGLGWQVHILPGEDHVTAMQPRKAIPLIRDFLGPILQSNFIRS